MTTKTSISLLFVGLSLGFLTLPTLAETKPDCKNPMTQLDMTMCAGRAAQASDREITQVYRQLRANYKGTSQDNRLVTAQLAWLRFRDAECKAAAGRFEGGSMAPMVYAGCSDRLTQQRIQDLKRYLEEG